MSRLTRREISVLIGFWAIAVVIAVVVSRLIPTEAAEKPLLLGIEACVYLLVLVFVASLQPFHVGFLALARVHRVIIALLVCGFVVAQLSKSTRTTYPFVAWNMYAESPPSDTVVFVELEGVTKSGATLQVTPESILPSLNRYRITSSLRRNAVESSALADAGARRKAKRKYQQTITALMEIYNQTHPQDPLKELRVHLGHFDYTRFTGDAQVSRRVLNRLVQR